MTAIGHDIYYWIRHSWDDWEVILCEFESGESKSIRFDKNLYVQDILYHFRHNGLDIVLLFDEYNGHSVATIDFNSQNLATTKVVKKMRKWLADYKIAVLDSWIILFLEKVEFIRLNEDGSI